MSEIVRDILRSVTLAFRPLNLGELAILAGLPPEDHTNPQAVEDFVEQCGSFLVIKDADSSTPIGTKCQSEVWRDFQDKALQRTVHFVHLSAKDYLLSLPEDELFPQMCTKEHESITRRCLDYLDTFKSDEDLKASMQKGWRYPLSQWRSHGDVAGERLSASSMDYELFQPQSKLAAAWKDWKYYTSGGSYLPLNCYAAKKREHLDFGATFTTSRTAVY